jgi:hypothetical protein
MRNYLENYLKVFSNMFYIFIQVWTVKALNNEHNLTEILIARQTDFTVAHQYYQNQYYYFYSAFKVYLARMVGELMLDLGAGMDDFKDIITTTNDQLATAPESCRNIWDFYQIVLGRGLASCTMFAYDEVSFMTSYHNTAIWYSEYMTNDVQTKGMNIFSNWNPLTAPNRDVNGELNNELRLSLNRFLQDDYPFVRGTEEYIFSNFEGITHTYEMCVESYINALNFTSNYLVTQAGSGMGECENV